MKLAIPIYSSDQFTWKGNQGCAEHSDFGSLAKIGRKMFIAGQVYDDACDRGFYVISTKTGVRMLFTYVFDDDGCDGYDGEVEVYSSGDYTITILND